MSKENRQKVWNYRIIAYLCTKEIVMRMITGYSKQILTAVVLFLTVFATAQTVSNPAQPTAQTVAKNLAEQKYAITVGDVVMTIDGGGGGKILSLKYKDNEVINQSRWPESFGSTFWTSPQKEWNWPPVPELDKRPYTIDQESPTLVMTSEVSEKLKYKVRKEFATDTKNGAFVITYSITNEADETRSVAPWEITRVPNAGVIFFDAPVEGITPAGLMDFKAEHGVAWYTADEAPQNRKVNADGKGWLAYANNGLLLVKAFQDLEASQPAPGEAEIQVYMNRGKTYIELESQGAYTALKPGETLSWTVKWFLVPCADTGAALIDKVKKLVKR